MPSNRQKQPLPPKKEVFMDKMKGREALLKVREILTKSEVDFFLILGTALGAYRDKGFTPTEKDVDLGFLYENFAASVGDITKSLILNGFDVRSVSYPFRQCRVLVAHYREVKVDLVSYVINGDKRFCSNSDQKTKPYSIVHDRETLERYEPIQLFGETFSVPSPIERYLELEYGEDWRTPRQDHKSRTRHYHYRREQGIKEDFLDAIT